jgi:hypothetical protein
MTTVDFITQLLCRVDDRLGAAKHPLANLYASEVVTLALLYALSGKGQRAYGRWLSGDYRYLFPNLPDRSRLFRLFNSHRHYLTLFLAEPSLIGVIDSHGIELLHPIREGRSNQHIGKKGQSNKPWIVGGKLCFLLNHMGLIVNWQCDTANVHDGSALQQLIDGEWNAR